MNYRGKIRRAVCEIISFSRVPEFRIKRALLYVICLMLYWGKISYDVNKFIEL